MELSRESKLVCGVLLISVPTIMYGGLTLLGILTEGQAGLRPGNLALSETQWALWRAGHAHAGVYVLLSLILQPLVDHTTLSNALGWAARLGAPAASILLPAGFFGFAFIESFRWLMYFGAVCLAASLLITGVGLLRNLKSDAAKADT
jgi:hypothetical protein